MFILAFSVIVLGGVIVCAACGLAPIAGEPDQTPSRQTGLTPGLVRKAVSIGCGKRRPSD